MNPPIKGSVADDGGNFSLEIQKNERYVIISCVGYLKKKIALTDIISSDLNLIYLNLENIALDDILIRKRKVKYSATKSISTRKSPIRNDYQNAMINAEVKIIKN